MNIGSHALDNPVILAPLSGITDYPFRQVARKYGVGMTVSEMVASAEQLRDSKKSTLRRIKANEDGPIAVQLVGNDPKQMAMAAQYNVEQGAKIIDINMGCPAKKVLKKAAGSALLENEGLVADILEAVVNAVDVPVTLKIRTGIDPEHKNGIKVAQLAEQAGVQSLAVHGRTRACKFNGQAEHSTLAQIKRAVRIPVVANGDIDSLTKAQAVAKQTKADAIMVGRAALGRPWFLQQLATAFENGLAVAPCVNAYQTPPLAEQQATCLWHLDMMFAYYGNFAGVRIARKHVRWYLKEYAANNAFLAASLKTITKLERPDDVLQQVGWFYAQIDDAPRLVA